jgi:tRNA threonylcarbamoyladenosine biosynthesis protein TsaE
MEGIITNTIKETTQLAKKFVQDEINGQKIVCLKGELGAGKPTFTQGILKEFGAVGPYTSPTFTIVKEYDVDKYEVKKIYHIDAYRIGSDDMQTIGWDDMIANDNALIIIEWPENIIDILPQNAYVILCEMVSEAQRKYTFIANGKAVVGQSNNK